LLSENNIQTKKEELVMSGTIETMIKDTIKESVSSALNKGKAELIIVKNGDEITAYSDTTSLIIHVLDIELMKDKLDEEDFDDELRRTLQDLHRVY